MSELGQIRHLLYIGESQVMSELGQIRHLLYRERVM